MVRPFSCGAKGGIILTLGAPLLGDTDLDTHLETSLMPNRPLIGLLILAATTLSACGPSEDVEQAASDQPLLEQARAKARAAADKAAEVTGTALARGKEMAAEAGPALGSAREAVADTLHKAADLAAEQGAVAAQAVEEVADAAVEKARELIGQAQAYIAENKPQLAQQAVNKLNVLKDVMPAAIQTQIDKLNAHLEQTGTAEPADDDAETEDDPTPPKR